MLSVRPKVAELAFHVFSRSLHPELIDVQTTRRIERDRFNAKVDITNCGHVVTFNSGNATLCEVATSAHQPLPSRRCVLQKTLKGSRTEEVQCRSGLQYKTHFQLDTVKPEVFWMVGQQLGKSPTEGLLHQFSPGGRIALGAISYVNIETRRSSLLIQAIHTFPDDFAIVKVETIFTVGESTTPDVPATEKPQG